jgi:putative DNA primase/helicase
MKWAVPAAKGVLYVDGEMGLDDIQARLPRIHQSESKRVERPLRPLLRYFADSDLALFPDGLPNLGTPEGKALLEAHLDGVSLLILDNLSTLYNSAIENEAESWVATQDWMKGLRRRGMAVLFVHHAGKGGQQRGTSKREDLCNNVIALKQPENHQASDGAAFTLFFEKSRGVHGPLVDPLAAKLIEDEDGDLVWALHEEKNLHPQILALKEEGLGVRETARALGISPGTVSKVLARHSISRGGVSVSNPYRGDWKHSETHPSTKETPPETPRKHFPKTRTK